MSKAGKSSGRGISRDILSRIVSRIVLAFILYIVLGALAAFLMMFYYKQNIWYGGESFYLFMHFVYDNLAVCVSIYTGVGLFLISVFYIWKLLKYLENMIDATEELLLSEQPSVVFPKELSEIGNRIGEIKRKVEQSQHAAREAEQRKNDLVVYLAHDLKTPLTSVIGYLTLLHDEQQISLELQKKYLAISLEKAERLEDLINEFFEITRFSLTHLTLEQSRINLTRMLEQTIYEFQPMFDEKDLKCHLAAEQNLMFFCDPDKLQRVFDNLLRNAVNYSFEHSTIQITVSHDGTWLFLTVENQGNTIPEEKLGRIFEQFFRLDTARTSRSGGAGLGLAIAKEIVELHKGTITARSSDETVCFQVKLPFSS